MISYTVKIIEGTQLDELKGETVHLRLNLDTGTIELIRPNAELPFYGIGWNEITNITYNTKGMLKKTKTLEIKSETQVLSVEIKDKKSIEEIEKECQEFLEQAKQKHPKGALQKALEPLKDVLPHLKKAQQALGSVAKKTSEGIIDIKDKATTGLIDAKDKATGLMKKQTKQKQNKD